MCHGLLLLTAFLLMGLSACAGNSGWSRTSARTCEHRAPPRLCVVAEPDHGHVLGAADVELLPGECAVAGSDGRGGLLRVRTRDREGHERSRWLSVPRGRFTVVSIEEDGKVHADHLPCSQGPI
ncbi:MAG: hypothetical protein KC457_24415 [Myxococcales bacterium]|nr:hypothetical protein [Myxococcales bacterium]